MYKSNGSVTQQEGVFVAVLSSTNLKIYPFSKIEEARQNNKKRSKIKQIIKRAFPLAPIRQPLGAQKEKDVTSLNLD